jgi:hypothetical protein
MGPADALDFVRRNAAWAAVHRARLPAPIALVLGTEIEILGQHVCLRHASDQRGC